MVKDAPVSVRQELLMVLILTLHLFDAKQAVEAFKASLQVVKVVAQPPT